MEYNENFYYTHIHGGVCAVINYYYYTFEVKERSKKKKVKNVKIGILF